MARAVQTGRKRQNHAAWPEESGTETLPMMWQTTQVVEAGSPPRNPEGMDT